MQEPKNLSTRWLWATSTQRVRRGITWIVVLFSGKCVLSSQGFLVVLMQQRICLCARMLWSNDCQEDSYVLAASRKQVIWLLSGCPLACTHGHLKGRSFFFQRSMHWWSAMRGVSSFIVALTDWALVQCKAWSVMWGKLFAFFQQSIQWNATCDVSAINGAWFFNFVWPEYALSKCEMWNACFSRPCITGMQSVNYNLSAGKRLYFYCSIECTDQRFEASVKSFESA